MGKRTAEAEPNSKWPAANIEWRQTHSLLAYQRNSRIHSDAQVDQIAASMKEFGWTIPMLVDEEGIIIAGHGRALAAAKIGISSVPVMVAKGWTEAQKMAYRIADNRLPESASWDTDMLKLELTELGKMDFDLSLTGFDELELVQFVATPNVQNPDEAPEPPARPVTMLGDLWKLGRHRVLCGDSTSAANVAQLVNGAKIDLILTDPPYCSGGFQESTRSAGSVGTDAEHKKIANDTLSTRGYQALLKTAFSAFNAPFLYAFTDWRMWVYLFDIAESSGFGVRSMIVWDKGTPGMGRGWRAQHELILWACGETAPWDKHDGGSGNVIQCKRTGNINHTTEKPIELLQALLGNTPFIRKVADPFAGSGSTLIACEASQRDCYAIEMDPSYVDVIIQRWQTYTGQEATLEATGETYTEVANKRLNPPQPTARKRKA